MAEFTIQHRKQKFSESDTVSQRKSATVLQDNRGQVSHTSALPDNRTAQLAPDPKEKPNNTGLPNQLKTGIESLSGMSMDHVKVHYNSAQPAQLNAHAYAQGSDIHLAPGQEKHLPHEAWHVVQQAQGRVKPTMQMKRGMPVNDDVGLEREADVMGARALAKTQTQFVKREADSHSSKNHKVSYQRYVLNGAPIVQRVSDLHVQQGPSCWLFVLEAIAASKGVNTESLRMIMHSYASSEEADHQVKTASKEIAPRVIDRRQAALEVTAEKLNKMVNNLRLYVAGGNEHHDSSRILHNTVLKKSRQYLASEASVASLTFVNNMADTQGIIDVYEKARIRALSLVEITKHEADDVGSLLQSGSQEITRDQNFSDIVLTLQHANLPAYMSIRKRFKPTGPDFAGAVGGVIDFTGRSTKLMSDTSHAVLLESYNNANKTVRYKDPNYGNSMIEVKVGQLKEMAGAGRVLIRPFIKDGVSKSRLSELVDL